MVHDVTGGGGPTKGVDFTYESDGANVLLIAREYAVRAIVDPGDAPTLGNLPATLSLYEDAAVGQEVFQATFDDVNTRQTLQIYIVEVTPAETPVPFSMDAAGKVTLDKAMTGKAGTQYAVKIEVFDGCLATSSTLTVNVISTLPLPALVPGACLAGSQNFPQIDSFTTDHLGIAADYAHLIN
jgi:hypothetical protein